MTTWAGVFSVSLAMVLGPGPPGPDGNGDKEPDPGMPPVVQDSPRLLKRIPPKIGRRDRGWVLVTYNVNPDGSVADVAFLDSSGNRNLEREIARVMVKWRFEPPTQDGMPVTIPGNEFLFTAVTLGPGSAATKKRFDTAMMHVSDLVNDGRLDDALEELRVLSGDAYLTSRAVVQMRLMRAEIYRRQERPRQQLWELNGALSIGWYGYGRTTRADWMAEKFRLEARLANYQAALVTLEVLGRFVDVSRAYPDLMAAGRAIDALRSGGAPFAVEGLVEPVSDTAMSPRWQHWPLRQKFGFEDIDGELESLELRCPRQLVTDKPVADRTWQFPASWGRCQLVVFGTPGTRFRLIEYSTSESG